MNKISLKRIIAFAAIAVLFACNIAGAGSSVVSHAAAAATEEAAEAGGTTEKAAEIPDKKAGKEEAAEAEGTTEKAAEIPDKKAGKEEAAEAGGATEKAAEILDKKAGKEEAAEAGETSQEVKETSDTDKTVKETPEAPAEEPAKAPSKAPSKAPAKEAEKKASEAAAAPSDKAASLKDGGLIEDENAKDDVVIMKDEQYKADVFISIADAASGEELAGAQLTVTKVRDIDGNETSEIIDSWTSDGSSHEVMSLTDGTYELVEDQAPLGYQTAKMITFNIKDGELVEDENANDGVVTMKDEQYKVDVSISKVDAASGKELVGAILSITREGQEAASGDWTWVSDGSVHVVEDLTDGTYVLTEESAPKGYKKAASITFEIKEGRLVDSEDAKDGVVTMKGEQYKTNVSISKVDAADGKELAGAQLTVTKVRDIDGNETSEIIDSWTSDGSQHEIEGLVDGIYTLAETSAPKGYEIAESIGFEAKDGKLVEDENAKDGVVTMKDEQYKTIVKVSKVDIADGKELEGAHIQILDKDGHVVAEWDSTKTAKEITGLQTGVTYTLRETAAPYGYYPTSDKTFILNADGTVDTEATTATVKDGVILVEDKITEIRIVKADENLIPISGAKLRIEDAKGTTIKSWTSSSDGYTVVQGLQPGVTYRLIETKAPAGYKKAETITFTIDAEGNIKIKSGKGRVKDDFLVMVDKKSEASDTNKHTGKGEKNHGTRTGEKNRGARTGDDNNFMLWIVAAAAAAGGTLGLVTRRKRNTK